MNRLEILGGLRLVEDGKPKELASGGRLLAYLALHAPNAVDRRKCAADLYPEDEYDVSGNRIRVALARFKKSLGESLISEGRDLQLSAVELSVDFWEAEQEIQTISDQIDVSEELEGLERLLPGLERRLLPDIHDGWVEGFRGAWDRECVTLCRRTVDLATGVQKWELAREASRIGLLHDENNIGLWRTYLRSAYYCREVESALGDLNRFEESGNCSLSADEILELRNSVKELAAEGKDVAARWSESQLLNLGRMFARVIEEAPGDAASFFLLRGAIGEFYRDPSGYLPFLDSLVSTGALDPEVEQDIRLQIVDASGLRYDSATVLEQTSQLLTMDLTPARKGRALFSRSFAAFQNRNYEAAIEAITESSNLHASLGDELRASNSRMVEGAYRWHMGEIDRALEIYAAGRARLEMHDDSISKANITVNWANMTTIYFILGDINKAKEGMRSCFQAMGEGPNENMMAMFHSLAGAVTVAAGDTLRGVDLLVDGLKRSYRRDSDREMQIGLEWAAGALMEGNFFAESLAVLDWVAAWRSRTNHVRSVAETMYADRIRSRCGDVSVTKLDPDASPKKVISFVIGRLRELDQRRSVA